MDPTLVVLACSCHNEGAREFPTPNTTSCCLNLLDAKTLCRCSFFPINGHDAKYVFNLNAQTCRISASCLQVNSRAVEHGRNSPTNWFECGDLELEGLDLDDRLKEFILVL